MPDLVAKLQRAWRRQHGEAVSIQRCTPISAGASATSYRLQGRCGDTDLDAVLQLASAGETFGVALEKPVQAAVQQRACAAGICTPPVLLTVGAEDDLPAGFVSQFQAGETLGRRIVSDPAFADARGQLASDCAQALAAIHALPTQDFPELPLRDARLQLDELASLQRGLGEALPVFEAAFAWLRMHVPSHTAAAVVHGDFRVGNFLVDQRGLVGVLDWELAHIGDPLEDIGWLCMRSWRFGQVDCAVGGFAQRADFYAAYEQAGGHPVSVEAVRYWELLACVKWGVICQWFAHQRLRGVLSGLEPALTGRRVSEVQIQILDLLQHGKAA